MTERITAQDESVADRRRTNLLWGSRVSPGFDLLIVRVDGLNIMDFAGRRRRKAMRRAYYRKSRGHR